MAELVPKADAQNPKRKRVRPPVRTRECVAVCIKLLAVSRERPPHRSLMAWLKPIQALIAKTLKVGIHDRAIQWVFDHAEASTSAKVVQVLLYEPRRPERTRPDYSEKPLTPEIEREILRYTAEEKRVRFIAWKLKISKQLVSRVSQAHKYYAQKLISAEERDQILKGIFGDGQK